MASNDLPDIFLKRSAAHIESDGEFFAFPGKVFAELPLCFQKNRMPIIFGQFIEAHAAGAVVLPKDGHKALITRDQFQSAHGRIYRFQCETHSLFLVILRSS